MIGGLEALRLIELRLSSATNAMLEVENALRLSSNEEPATSKVNK